MMDQTNLRLDIAVPNRTSGVAALHHVERLGVLALRSVRDEVVWSSVDHE